jgi:hypothetical protein
VWLRGAALALVLVGVFVGLTVYFSSEPVAPCLVSGTARWRPPADPGTHRYEVVVVDRTACFFATDEQQKLVGALPISQAGWLTAALPAGAEPLTVHDREHGVTYVTERGLLGVRVLDDRTERQLYVVHFKGFTWNPRFGPDPPSHGLSLAPDRPELWVLDAPNSAVHVFDVSALPGAPPRPIGDIRLSKPISGDESPCSRACARSGSLQHSSDGRFAYVGDAGDVIDTTTRALIGNLPALHNSRVTIEVDWVDGKRVFPDRR